MLFNSLQYCSFLAVVVLAYHALPQRGRWVLLLAASFGFYMSWNANYLVLILLVIVVNYAAGLVIARATAPARRRAALIAGVSVSLGLLFVFKYWGFSVTNLLAASRALGLAWDPPFLEVLLPVGISFYTFQSLSYTIDVYRRRVPTEPHLGRFALYVSFFPQLVAGPIERAQRLLPQLTAHHRFDFERFLSGIELIAWGLFKKVVIADRLALYVDAVYGNAANHSGSSFLLATYAFAFQIYCDFSSYSDIAVGSARLLGIDLMENFRAPYQATNVRDFWRRWHISLSTWLRDYLYIPLGGNRRGPSRTHVNLLITMLLGGLWHGASWNFVVWGAIHGALLSLSRMTAGWRDRAALRMGVPAAPRAFVGAVVTFHLVCAAWVFFRAATFDDSMLVFERIFSDRGSLFVDRSTFFHAGFGLSVLFAVEWMQRRGIQPVDLLARAPVPLRFTAWQALLFSILLFGVEDGVQFIYFQF